MKRVPAQDSSWRSREGADLVAPRIERAPRGPVQLDLLLADPSVEGASRYETGRARVGCRGGVREGPRAGDAEVPRGPPPP